MKNTLLIISVALVACGCNTTQFSQTSKDGSSISVKNTRVFWSTESYSCTFTTNTASLTANKSNVDSAAVAAIAQGVVQGMAAAK